MTPGSGDMRRSGAVMESYEELRKLDDDDLQKFFEKNARYRPTNPTDSQYSIHVAGRGLYSNDTRELRNRFFDMVRLSEMTNEELIAYHNILKMSSKLVLQVTDDPEKSPRHRRCVDDLLKRRGIKPPE
jgi:hypothetical protein